jgi:hypothetical protein
MYDYYKNSVAIPLWSELCVTVYDQANFAWQFSDKTSAASLHVERQYKGFSVAKTHKQIKLFSPWRFKTKEDLNWLFTNPIYNRQELQNYLFCQGFLNFKHQTATHMQLFLDVSTPRTYIIPFGSVFLLTPLTDKKVVIHRHLVSKEYFESIGEGGMPISFISKYKKQQRTTKCPYKDNLK